MATRFTHCLSGLLYSLLIAVLCFVAVIIIASIVIVVGDRVAPGLFGTVHVRSGAIDLRQPGAAPALIGVMILALALAAGALLPLIAMLRSTMAGDPFTPANVRRLHIIAGIIATAYAAQMFLPFVLPASALGMVEPLGGGGVFALLLTLVLAEVFREGARLREENEGTV